MRSIALVDCNNFYVSCERLFRPGLEGKPVVVLSNNDGCVVSRSQEVRDLGIKMAVPWFQLKQLAKRHGIVALSSNYALYADISGRVMLLLSQFSPNQEIYSIDECFLDLTGMEGTSDLTSYAQTIRGTIRQCVGIPVCIGIAPSKTLAKLANHVAKKHKQFHGVCDFNAMTARMLDNLLARIEVGEVWGVGRRSTERLQQMGISTVLELKYSPAKRVRAEFGVVMERIVAELNGEACIGLDEITPPRQQIICSRSFGVPVSLLADLEQAVIAYASRAAEKLRSQFSIAGGIQVYIRTNPHKDDAPQYQQSTLVTLPEPTDDSRLLCRAALDGLRQIYRSGYLYQKAGVMLTGIIPATSRPRTLFDDVAAQQKSTVLMETLDRINRRMGIGTMQLLGEGVRKSWSMRRGNVSQCYTTEWDELAVVRSGTINNRPAHPSQYGSKHEGQ
jgi:DNA polymerase V